jgi:beta-phosphoglucomutase-like phosphatase (HAD superfamily)
LKRQRPVARGAVLALEDGALGIRAARAANVRCIAVGPISAHIAMEADAYVPSLQGQSLASLDELSRPGQERVQ